MIAFIGLGNVGSQYANTKHNAGFWVIDEWTKRHKIVFKPGKDDYLFSEHKKNKIILIKPTTGMNKSGIAVKAVMKKWNLKISDLFIIFDDVDLPLGTIRIKPKGGDGCHRGLENIIYNLNTNGFSRIKFGIGTDENMRPAEKYVLRPFKIEKSLIVNQAINRAVDALDSLFLNGLSYTMNYFNKK